MAGFILSCDWGTSSFRLRLVNMQNHEIVGEVFSNEGVAVMHNRWLNGRGQGIRKEAFYLQHLKEKITGLPETAAIPSEEIQVVISGMASSSIGVMELPYACVPFPLDGSNALVHWLEPSSEFPYPACIISGVGHQMDVMRGEETQVVGLACRPEHRPVFEEDIVCIFPGTHSKHINISGGEIVDFQTCITGELFDVMSNHSILKNSVSSHDHEVITPAFRDAFCRGVRQSGESSLLNTLFKVRVAQLFEYLTKEENYFYLSGLLIGAELRSLPSSATRRIMICSGSNVFHLYQLAIGELELPGGVIFVDPDKMDRVVVAGHIKILQNTD